MACGCKQDHSETDTERRYGELLDRAGLREIVDHGRSALDMASEALGHLARAERAEALGFGKEVAVLHREAAERGNRRAQRQFRILVDRLEARRRAEDWPALVKEAQAEFGAQGGGDQLDDAREDFRVRLLEEEPGMSAGVAEQVLALFDHVVERARSGSLDAVLDLMRETSRAAQGGFGADEMGRQPAGQASNLFHGGGSGMAGGQNVNGWCVAFAACEAWAFSSFAAALIICFAVPFCWCCFFPILMAALMAHHLTCIAVFAPPCSAGK